MSAVNPTPEQVDTWIDVLDRAEPDQPRGNWGEAYDRLHLALLHARKLRRYCLVPAAIAAGILVIVFHGQVWDFDDMRNVIGAEGALLIAIFFTLTKIFPVLAREDRVQTLLRYYGATDVPHEEEALQ